MTSFCAGVFVVIVILNGVILPFHFDLFGRGLALDEHAQIRALPPNVQRARRFARVQHLQTFDLLSEIVMNPGAVALSQKMEVGDDRYPTTEPLMTEDAPPTLSGQ